MGVNYIFWRIATCLQWSLVELQHLVPPDYIKYRNGEQKFDLYKYQIQAVPKKTLNSGQMISYKK